MGSLSLIYVTLYLLPQLLIYQCTNLQAVTDQTKRMASVEVGQGAIVCSEAIITGEVTIGGGTIVHPKARIEARAGPIIIGENNIIEEMVEIINEPGREGPEGTVQVMII